MRLILIALLCIGCGSACSDLNLDIEIQGNEPFVLWDSSPELFYAQIQILVTSGSFFSAIHIADNNSLSLGELPAGEYTAAISYLYPSCPFEASSTFVIEDPPDIHYASSSGALFDYGLWMLLGTVIALCIILILRR